MTFSDRVTIGRMSEMNITPLVDVMLVVLIIFMVTMPLHSVSIGVDLPQPAPNHPPPQTSPVDLAINASGQLTWNGSDLPMSALRGTMQVESQRYADASKQPVIRINTDKDAPYEVLATVLANAKNAGLTKIGFVDNGQR